MYSNHFSSEPGYQFAKDLIEVFELPGPHKNFEHLLKSATEVPTGERPRVLAALVWMKENQNHPECTGSQFWFPKLINAKYPIGYATSMYLALIDIHEREIERKRKSLIPDYERAGYVPRSIIL